MIYLIDNAIYGRFQIEPEEEFIKFEVLDKFTFC